VSHRRDQKDKLRREREEKERQAREAAQRKRMVGIGAGAVLALLAVAVVVVLLIGGGGDSEGGGTKGGGDTALWPDGGTVPDPKIADLPQAAKAAGCTLKSFPANSRSHINDPNQRVKYSSNPPTSGKHFFEPADDGIYNEAPTDERLVHTMEHGRVIIWVKPSVPAQDRADIRALVDDDSYQMVLVPRKNMPDPVAVTAWSRDPQPNGTGRLMSCPEVTPEMYDAIRNFRDEHRSNGPEDIP
jgi:hypothetical protein